MNNNKNNENRTTQNKQHRYTQNNTDIHKHRYTQYRAKGRFLEEILSKATISKYLTKFVDHFT
jgi:hypothetical protein